MTTVSSRLYGMALAVLPFTAIAIPIGENELSLGVITTSIIGFYLYLRSLTLPTKVASRAHQLFFMWLIFLLFLYIGYVNQLLDASHFVAPASSKIFDLSAYAVVACNILFLANALKKDLVTADEILRTALFAYVALILLGLVAFIILGPVYPLSENRVHFFPLARNLHHIATACLIFLVIAHQISDELVNPITKISSIVILSVAIYYSGSSKALLGLAIFLAASVMFWLAAFAGQSKNGGKVENRIMYMFFALAFSVMCFTVLFSQYPLFDRMIYYFVANDGGGARSSIYQLALQRFADKPLFGSGPGVHIFDGRWRDAHSTLLSLLLQVGLLGAGVFVWMFIQWVNSSIRSKSVLFFLAVLMSYIILGDTLRMLILWLCIILLSECRFKSEKVASVRVDKYNQRRTIKLGERTRARIFQKTA